MVDISEEEQSGYVAVSWLDILRKMDAETASMILSTVTKGEEDDVEEKEVTCPICWDTSEEDGQFEQTSCNHTFHKSCLSEWLKRSKTCPFCRTRIVLPNKDGLRSGRIVNFLREIPQHLRATVTAFVLLLAASPFLLFGGLALLSMNLSLR